MAEPSLPATRKQKNKKIKVNEKSGRKIFAKTNWYHVYFCLRLHRKLSQWHQVKDHSPSIASKRTYSPISDIRYYLLKYHSIENRHRNYICYVSLGRSDALAFNFYLLFSWLGQSCFVHLISLMRHNDMCLTHERSPNGSICQSDETSKESEKEVSKWCFAPYLRISYKWHSINRLGVAGWSRGLGENSVRMSFIYTVCISRDWWTM